MTIRELVATWMALRTARRVSVTDVSPEDTIIIEHPMLLSVQQADNLRAACKGLLPTARVVVFSGGTTFKVLKAAPSPGAQEKR